MIKILEQYRLSNCPWERTHLLSRMACEALEKNKECYVAMWILQNPDESIADYTVCTQSDWGRGEHRYWMERRV